jgi:hypothetical protein
MTNPLRIGINEVKKITNDLANRVESVESAIN